MPVSYGFLLVLIITTLELSIASPGIPAACTVVLRSLGLPIDYVGLITTYRLLTDNYGAACSISYSVLEEFELSHKLGEIDSDKDRGTSADNVDVQVSITSSGCSDGISAM